MVLTVEDLIKAQMRIVLASANDFDSVTDQQFNDAMQANNMMLDSWSANKLMIRSLVQQSFPLVASTSAYTIGTGMAFNTVKPIAIPNAFVRDSANLDYPLNIASEDEYNAYGDKALTPGVPLALFYDVGDAQEAGVPSGIINIYPMPDQAYTLYIDQQKYLTEMQNLSDTLTFEAAYYRALKFNGALEYYYEYRSHKYPIPPDLEERAKESKDTIINMNATPVLMRTDLPGVKTGKWNVMSDSYS